MNNLNSMKWQEFKINEIFLFQRGKRYKKTNHLEGKYKYIASTLLNNGIDSYVGETLKNKPIGNSIGLNNSGSIGKAFYHKDKCIYSDHVTALKLRDKELNEFIACFLIPILEKIRSKYSFSREINNNRLKKEIIMLPVDAYNNPDWKFMENYIKERTKKIVFKSRNTFKIYNLVLNSIKWKTFKLSELFKIEGSGESKIKKEIKTGKYNYITTKASNNGIDSKSDYYNNLGNCLTIDSATDGICFFQDNPFVASDHVEVLHLKNYELNRWLALFFITVLNQNMYLYNYGRKRSQTRLKKEIIMLPVDAYNNPDWKFMENYIKERTKNIYF